MIADAKWSLLGWLDEGVNVYADQSYKLENTSGTVYTGNKHLGLVRLLCHIHQIMLILLI